MVVFTPVDGRPDREWIAPRLGDWNTMHSVVPHGYQSYVRVFHPIDAQQLDWTGEGYVTLEERTLRWSDVAELTGTVAHPLMQWNRIGGALPPFRHEARAWQYGEPLQGSLPIEWFSRIAGILGGATRGGGCRAALWEGCGWLHPGGSSAVAIRPDDADSASDPPPPIEESVPFSPAEWEGRKLELPQRAYFGFDGDLGALADPAWADDSGWGWGTSFWHDTPNLLWPVDRSWFLVSEIDFDSTVIGCSPVIAEQLVADPLLETALIPEGASLQFNADTINR